MNKSISTSPYDYNSLIFSSFIISSANCSFCIDNDGNVYSFGSNKYCKLGNKIDGKVICSPYHISCLKDIKMVSCGWCHTVCLDYSGIVYTFGCNIDGKLGIGTDILNQIHLPQQLNLPYIIYISTGALFTICLSKDRELYSFGNNKYGQLGLGDFNDCFSPRLIPYIQNIDFIESNGGHSICKLLDNTYYSWGYNTNGQLGSGNFNNESKPMIRNNWPNDILFIKCGIQHSLLLTHSGYVYSFGYNKVGQLGFNKDIERITIPSLIKDLPEIQQIGCGYGHSLCLDINYNLWVFGDNGCGQLGIKDKDKIFQPIKLNNIGKIIDFSIDSGIHTFIKTINNKIYTFGDNSYCQLGIRTNNSKIREPIQIFKDNENIWGSKGNNRIKSARK